MATPSSSTTSPSPPMAYLSHLPHLSHAPGQQQASMASQNEIDREQRNKAVQKFLARAEISMVTRALRARLSYASYKATHNIPHVALRDLETQSQNQSQTASFSRTIAAKRKAAGTNNYYNNPTTQGEGAGNHRKSGSGTMAPPTSGSSPRTYYSSIHGTPGYSNGAAVPNLYSSILAPPPAKQARTIHNPSDPFISAPVRPTTPKPRVAKSSSIHDGNHLQPKGKHSNKTSKAPVSPNRRRNKRASVDKGKQKRHSGNVDVDGDIDMKAAATLTSLFMHHRPSIPGSASSPRSSIDGSEVGSVYSLSHFAQSSARTSTVNPPVPVSAASSSTTIAVDPGLRPQTPPSGSQVQHTTPRPAPTDTEAADLMLFLATSPSPARPANKDAKDVAAYRALSGGSGPLRSKGRVLFSSASVADPPSGREDVPAATAGAQPALARGGQSSFTSSISSIGTDLGGGTSGLGDSSHETSIRGPVNMSVSEPSQLLPPAPLPLLPSVPASPGGRRELISSPKPGFMEIAGGCSNPMPLDFNFHEFINASPSPSRGPSQARGGDSGHKSNLGLRADIGRKLFEEEQTRHSHIHSLQTVAAPAMGGSGNRQEDYTLSAGIDLVQS